MNYTKESNTGIDISIDRLQRRLYDKLSSIGSVQGYSRVYKNMKNEKTYFEAYSGKNEYKNVMGIEKSRFFFHVEDDRDLIDAPVANVSVIFLLNLEEFYSGEDVLRKDEEIKQTVLSVLDKRPFTTTRMLSGTDYLQTILRSVPTSVKDVHPYHVFAVQGSMTYNIKNCA